MKGKNKSKAHVIDSFDTRKGFLQPEQNKYM
jgi:hypothetical protein